MAKLTAGLEAFAVSKGFGVLLKEPIINEAGREQHVRLHPESLSRWINFDEKQGSTDSGGGNKGNRANRLVDLSLKHTTPGSKSSLSQTEVHACLASGEALAPFWNFKTQATDPSRMKVSVRTLTGMPRVWIKAGLPKPIEMSSKYIITESGGTTKENFYEMIETWIEPLYPDVADEDGKRVAIFSDAGPGRTECANSDNRAARRLKKKGFCFQPGNVPNGSGCMQVEDDLFSEYQLECNANRNDIIRDRHKCVQRLRAGRAEHEKALAAYQRDLARLENEMNEAPPKRRRRRCQGEQEAVAAVVPLVKPAPLPPCAEGAVRVFSATLGREDLSLICNGGEISYDVGSGEKVTFVYGSPFAKSMAPAKVRHSFAKCGLSPITTAAAEHRSVTDDLDESVTDDVFNRHATAAAAAKAAGLEVTPVHSVPAGAATKDLGPIKRPGRWDKKVDALASNKDTQGNLFVVGGGAGYDSDLRLEAAALKQERAAKAAADAAAKKAAQLKELEEKAAAILALGIDDGALSGKQLDVLLRFKMPDGGASKFTTVGAKLAQYKLLKVAGDPAAAAAVVVPPPPAAAAAAAAAAPSPGADWKRVDVGEMTKGDIDSHIMMLIQEKQRRARNVG